jgi:hypothetical protein
MVIPRPAAQGSVPNEQEATTIVPPEGRRVSGRVAIRAALKPIFAQRPSARTAAGSSCSTIR